MLRGDIIIFACVLCLSKCHTVLKKTKKMSLRILPKVDVFLLWRWYCRGYGLFLNFLMAFEHHVWRKYSVRVWLVVTYVILVCA